MNYGDKDIFYYYIVHLALMSTCVLTSCAEVFLILSPPSYGILNINVMLWNAESTVCCFNML